MDRAAGFRSRPFSLFLHPHFSLPLPKAPSLSEDPLPLQKGECPYGHTATNALPISGGAFFYSPGNPLPPPSPWESLAKNMIRERQAPLKGKNNGVGEQEEPGWTGPIAPAPCPSIPSPTLASLSHFLPPPRKRVRNSHTSRGASLPDAACPDGHLR